MRRCGGFDGNDRNEKLLIPGAFSEKKISAAATAAALNMCGNVSIKNSYKIMWRPSGVVLDGTRFFMQKIEVLNADLPGLKDVPTDGLRTRFFQSILQRRHCHLNR